MIHLHSLHTLLADLRDVLLLRQAAAAELQRGEHLQMENLVTSNSCSQLSSRTVHVDTARGDQHLADGIDVVHAGPLQLVVQQLPVLGVDRHAHTIQPDLVELVRELSAVIVLGLYLELAQ